jgi:TolB-like protein
VVTVYAGAAFVIIELINNITEPLRLPEWTPTLVIVLLVIGFPIVIIFSWIYDIHPEGGIVKTEPVEKAVSIQDSKTSNGWKISSYISFIVILVLIAINIFGSKKDYRIDESLEKSIAVLPFRNLSGDLGQDFICDGLTEEVINNLYKVESLNRVPSLTTVLNYKNSNKDIAEIATELQVNYILECSYKKLVDKLRFSTLLIEAKTKDHIWQHDFDRPKEEYSSIPSDIALEIINQLKIVITSLEEENIKKVYTTNPVAYELYQQASFFKRLGRDEEGLASSVELLKEAIKLDPEFTLAYASLTESYVLQYWFKYDQSGDILVKAKETIDTALKIDPELPEVYIAFANYYYHGFLNYSEALGYLEKASELISDNPQIAFLKAVIYRRMGKWQEALTCFVNALEKDPLSQEIIFNQSETYFCLGKYQEALESLEPIKKTEPSNIIIFEHEIITYLLRDGNTNLAKEVVNSAARINIQEDVLSHALYFNPISIYLFDGDFQKALDYLSTKDWSGHFNIMYYHPKAIFIAWIYDLMGLPNDANKYYNSVRLELDSLLSIYPGDSRYSGAMGIACAGLGEKETAIKFARKAVEDYSLEKDAFMGLARVEELAWVYLMAGDYDQALEQIEILLSHPGPYSAPLMKLDPKWKPLWDHPDFIRLNEKYSKKGG